MKTLYLRMLKRLTSLEAASAEEFLQIELTKKQGGLDLDISVYEVADEEGSVVQSRVEHTASFLNPPAGDEAGICLRGFPQIDVLEEAGATCFEYTRSTHRTLRLLDEDELRQVVQAVLEDRIRRHRLAACDNMRSYVHRRLAVNDKEWVDLCDRKDRKKWKPWANAGQPVQSELFSPPMTSKDE